MRAVLPISLALLAATPCLALAQSTGDAMTGQLVRSVTVNGQGEALGTPDMATLRFSAMSRGSDAASAMAANADKMTAVRDRLSELGIEPRDMQTSSLSLNPYYEQTDGRGYDRSKIAGYEASNALMVRLRDVEEAGDVIDAAVKAGANGLDSLSFGFADQSAMMEEARVAAIADARSTATLLAEEAGAELGPVLTITEGGGGGGSPQPMMRMEMDAMASTPIEAGEQAVTARVTVSYRLE